MKKKYLVPLSLAICASLTGCLEQEEASSSPSQEVTITNTTGGDGGSDGGGSTGGGSNTGTTCSGTSTDGQGDGYPLHQFNLFLAGHQSWMPGEYSDSLASQTMPTIREASILFKSDSRLKVKFKVHSQPYPTAGEEYCYGRASGQASDAYNYTKLRFKVHLRDVLCNTPDPQNSNNCLSGFYLGNRYRTQFVDPISVDSCSPVIDFGSFRNQTQYGTVVEIEDVKADSTCQANNTFCPAEKIVRAASCWRMTMQVSTDFTQEFR